MLNLQLRVEVWYLLQGLSRAGLYKNQSLTVKAVVICSMSYTLALAQWVRGCVCVCVCVCVCARGRGLSLLEAFNISDSLQIPPPTTTTTTMPLSAKPEKRPEWSHLQVLMDYTAACISLRQCFWWMRFSVIHRAGTPEECCLIIKWWMSVRSCFSELCGSDILCREMAAFYLWSLWWKCLD